MTSNDRRYERVEETRIVLRQDVNALRPGPKTPDGKAASSRNSLTHGLTARTAVIRGEDRAEFDALHHAIVDDRKPEGELEIQLAGEIAACTWRLARARQHEGQLLERSYDLYSGRDASKLQLILRYSTAIERQLNRTIARLEYLQIQRRKSATSGSPLAPRPSPLVMAAGSSQPQFVSQTAQNTDNSPPIARPSPLATRHSLSCEVPSFEISEPGCNIRPRLQSLGVEKQEVHPGTRGQRGTR